MRDEGDANGDVAVDGLEVFKGDSDASLSPPQIDEMEMLRRSGGNRERPGLVEARLPDDAWSSRACRTDP